MSFEYQEQDIAVKARSAEALERMAEIMRAMLEIMAAAAIREMEAAGANSKPVTPARAYIQSADGRTVEPVEQSQEDT